MKKKTKVKINPQLREAEHYLQLVQNSRDFKEALGESTATLDTFIVILKRIIKAK